MTTTPSAEYAGQMNLAQLETPLHEKVLMEIREARRMESERKPKTHREKLEEKDKLTADLRKRLFDLFGDEHRRYTATHRAYELCEQYANALEHDGNTFEKEDITIAFLAGMIQGLEMESMYARMFMEMQEKIMSGQLMYTPSQKRTLTITKDGDMTIIKERE